MKKLLTLLLTLLMVFTLVGCNSKKDTPIVEEPEQQEEVVEPKVDEPIVGGYVDVEDKTLTDELKDIFNKALEGLMGATYEPVELVATQVVAGTNYKFLANGTKTTNPITKGTYYIYVNKDLQGNISLLDIEVIEESQPEEKKTVDPTKYSYWVVVYDQFGNELSRTTAKYGTTVKDPDGNDVKVITNTYFHTTVDYSSSHNDEPAPMPASTCAYIGTELYYVASKQNPYQDCYSFDLYKYTYDSINSKYVFDSNVKAVSDAAIASLGAILIPALINFEVGDFIHENSGNYVKCNFGGDGAELPTNCTVTFEPDKVSDVEVGDVRNSSSDIVTEITVPFGATISVNGNTITIGENEYIAVAHYGYLFNSFEFDPNPITTTTNIKVHFSENQP